MVLIWSKVLSICCYVIYSVKLYLWNKKGFWKGRCCLFSSPDILETNIFQKEIFINLFYCFHSFLFTNIMLQNVQVTEFPTCPICLYPPIAAKMTHCGHIYCWPCVLHYLAISDKPHLSKCPICYETVKTEDLKR